MHSLVYILVATITVLVALRRLWPAFDSKFHLWLNYALITLTYYGGKIISNIGYKLGFYRGPFLPNALEVSSEWLRGVLQKSFHLKGIDLPQIRSLTTSSDGLPKPGVTTMVLRLLITWEKEDPRLPKTLIVKSLPPGFRCHLQSSLLCTYREAIFYKDFGMNEAVFAEGSVTNMLPLIYHAQSSSWTGYYLTLMEDLRSVAVSASQLLGNQCWGPVSLPAKFASQDQATILESIFVRTADMHAKYWRDRSLLQKSWLKGVRWLLGRDRHSWELAMHNMKLKWERVKDAIKTGKTKVEWSSTVINALEAALKATNWNAFHKNFDLDREDMPFTLCQGDYHAANVMWAGDTSTGNDKLYLVDWSEVGVFNPFHELPQFMISNATIELRRAHEKRIFKAYYDRLVDKGVSPHVFTYDDCWQRYVAGGIERWLQMLVLLACFSLDSPAVFTDASIGWFHNQVKAFIEDHAGTTTKYEPALMTGYCLE